MKSVSLFLFLLPMLAGCMTTYELAWTTPFPEVGEIYVYRGSDDSVLKVTYTGAERFQDPWNEPARAHVFSWNVTGHQGDSFRFLEAVDGNGRIIGQFAHCGHIEPQDEWGGPLKCNRFSLYKYGAYGIPGAFGSGWLWGERIQDGHRFQQEITPLDMEPYTTARTAVADGDCLRLEADHSLVSSMPRSLPATVLDGDITMCEGQALPTKFQPMLPWVILAPLDVKPDVTYTLKSHHPGDGFEVVEPHDTPVFTWQPPKMPAYTGLETPVQLPLAKAHEIALSEDKEYARIMESGTVVNYVHYETGEAGIPFDGSVQHQRETQAVLVATNGQEARRVEVTMLRTTTAGVSDDSYEVRGKADTQPEPQLTRQAGTDILFAHGEKLHGYDLLDEWMGFTYDRWPPTDKWGPFHRGYTDEERGNYSLLAFYEDPTQNTTFGFHRPLVLVVDGRTGGMIVADVPRT